MKCDTDKDVITRLFGYPFYRSLTVILCFCFAKSLKQNDRRRDNLSTVCDISVLTSELAGCSELFRNFFFNYYYLDMYYGTFCFTVCSLFYSFTNFCFGSILPLYYICNVHCSTLHM
uniref:Uncharacterized protein n=1 Tax=Rhipicephalus microplus TaxID=6941 RepID=A0A6G5AIB5_RHIMP